MAGDFIFKKLTKKNRDGKKSSSELLMEILRTDSTDSEQRLRYEELKSEYYSRLSEKSLSTAKGNTISATISFANAAMSIGLAAYMGRTMAGAENQISVIVLGAIGGISSLVGLAALRLRSLNIYLSDKFRIEAKNAEAYAEYMREFRR